MLSFVFHYLPVSGLCQGWGWGEVVRLGGGKELCCPYSSWRTGECKPARDGFFLLQGMQEKPVRQGCPLQADPGLNTK